MGSLGEAGDSVRGLLGLCDSAGRRRNEVASCLDSATTTLGALRRYKGLRYNGAGIIWIALRLYNR